MITINEAIERLTEAKAIVGGDVRLYGVSNGTLGTTQVQIEYAVFESMFRDAKRRPPTDYKTSRHHSHVVGNCEFYAIERVPVTA